MESKAEASRLDPGLRAFSLQTETRRPKTLLLQEGRLLGSVTLFLTEPQARRHSAPPCRASGASGARWEPDTKFWK